VCGGLLGVLGVEGLGEVMEGMEVDVDIGTVTLGLRRGPKNGRNG